MAVVPGMKKSGRKKTDLWVQWNWFSGEVVKVLRVRSVRAARPPPKSGAEVQAGKKPAASLKTQESQTVRAANELRGMACPPAPPASQPSSVPAAPVVASPLPFPRPSGRSAAPTSRGRDASFPLAYGLGTGNSTASAHGIMRAAQCFTELVGWPGPRQAWSGRTPSLKLIHDEGDSVGLGRSRPPYDDFFTMSLRSPLLFHRSNEMVTWASLM